MDGGICSRVMKAAQSKKWDSSSQQCYTPKQVKIGDLTLNEEVDTSYIS